MARSIIWSMAAALFAAGTAFAAEQIDGVDSLSVGANAGLGGQANRTVAIGAGAGAYMTGGDSNLFVGAAAGLRAANVKSSVGMGHYALRGATNMTRVVGVGDLAFAGRSDVHYATWVNGQFYASGQEGKLWIKANPYAADTNAPIYYAGGTLYLNAERVVVPGGEIAGGSSSGSSAVDEADYDWYVDAASGDDDSHDGRSRTTAFRTLDRALWSAGSNDTVRVAAGEYAYPEFYAQKANAYVTNRLTGGVFFTRDYGCAPYGVTLVAPDGAEKTTITTNLPSANPGLVTGAYDGTTRFVGFSFVGAYVPPDRTTLMARLRGAFMLALFADCVFRDTAVATAGYAKGVWSNCVLVRCTVTDYVVSVADADTPANDGCLHYRSSIMNGCGVEDCDIDVATAANANGALPNWGAYNEIVDSTVRCGPLNFAPQPEGDGRGFADCLVLLDGFNAVPTGHGSTAKRYSGCIVGVGTNAAPPSAYAEWMSNAYGRGYEADSVYTNATAVLEFADADGRAKGRDAPRSWYFYGRKSAGDRALRDAMLLAVQSATNTASRGSGATLAGATPSLPEEDDSAYGPYTLPSGIFMLTNITEKAEAAQ